MSLQVDACGCITFGVLDSPVRPFADGSAIVLECGDGWWTREGELARAVPALSRAGHISVTGRFVERRGGDAGYGLICGLDGIAARLEQMLTGQQLSRSA